MTAELSAGSDDLVDRSPTLLHYIRMNPNGSDIHLPITDPNITEGTGEVYVARYELMSIPPCRRFRNGCRVPVLLSGKTKVES